MAGGFCHAAGGTRIAGNPFMSRRTPVMPAPRDAIERTICAVRGHRVMLDADLATLYGVETRALLQAVRRNAGRFPPDFMFQLDAGEAWALRSQSVISNGRGGRRYRPYVFTEQGVAMLSSVLKTARAIDVNIAIMRTFVRLRGILSTHKDLAVRLDALERRYDGRFRVVFEAIRDLMSTPPRARRPIGFGVPAKSAARSRAASTASGSSRSRRP
jgi:hypothetical protein